MPSKAMETRVAQQVELAIARLDSLSIMPSVAAKFLSQLNQLELTPVTLSDFIESDPALTAKIFALFHDQGLNFGDERPSISRALEKLSLRLIRDTFLSMNVYQVASKDAHKLHTRRQLIRHSLAVACCAKDIAEIALGTDNQPAFMAGLLHDIGKLALDEAMPKSFARLIEEAKSENTGLCAIEQKRLGADHTIFGKRLAQKWHLPDEIALAIWLHHSDTALVTQNIPEAKIAQIVQLADMLARQLGIGHSGSYDLPEAAKTAALLGLVPEQLEQIGDKLWERVEEKCRLVDLDSPQPVTAYFDTIRGTACQLAQNNAKLTDENRRLQTDARHFDFTKELLSSINSNATPITVAENLAIFVQKFYQTGPVCVYFVPPTYPQTLQAVVVESPSKIETIILNAPDEAQSAPPKVTNFTIFNATDYADWLLEQLDVEFDVSRAKLAILFCGGQTVGGIIFELRYPVDKEALTERFRTVASIGGVVLMMALSWQKQQRFAEQFVQLVSKVRQTGLEQVSSDSLDLLAEMAAGAAHELNNPLSVISGRAQLLAKSEDDPEKKQVLKQIQQNAGEISTIIDELMAFARLPEPRATQTELKQVLDEAIYLAAQKTNIEPPDVQLDIADDVTEVFADSAQIVSAIANVIANSIESYTEKIGSIKIAATTVEDGVFVKLEIIDEGCGMDSQTLRRATGPFFSAKPAGRKRGMGLAYTARIVELNKGRLNVTSQPGSGTTVTIHFPAKK